MTNKPKLLWCGDIAMTGFGRVTGALLPRLRDKYDIAVLGSNYHGDPCEEQNLYRVYPASNRFQQAPFGEERIREIIEKEQPDIVCSLNDPWLVADQYRRIEDLHKQGKFKFVGYLTMDSYNWLGGIDPHINVWDSVITFTEFGAYEFLKAGINRPITVIPHGLDAAVFYPMDKKAARKELKLSEDIFICFNGQRNQPRKRIDITIAAFAQFAVGRPDAQMYLHMGLKDQGWDALGLFGREMKKNGLDPNGRIIMTTNTPQPPNVPVEMLNTIYNVADVGINTTRGGGWELVNFEHAACRVAQVVPDHTSTKEIFEGHGELIRCDHVDVDPNYGREMPCPSVEHLVEILVSLYEDREKLDQVAQSCYERVTEDQFKWDNISDQFDGVFQEVLQAEPLVGAESVSPKKKGMCKKKRKKVPIGG